MEMKFTPEDEMALESLNRKLNELQTAVRSVVRNYDTGLFVWGEGGIGKSYTILGTLDFESVDYALLNSRVTGRGLFDALAAAPGRIHVIEDAERLFKDPNALGVLRSALFSQSKKRPPERVITWNVHGHKLRFTFTGSIIVVSNANLADSTPEMRAVNTRLRVFNLDVSTAEIIARMKDMCQHGYSFGQETMTPTECWQVAGYIIDKLPILQRNPDLRILRAGFHDYLHQKNHDTPQTWQQLLDGRMTERPAYKSRAEQTAEKTRMAGEIMAMKLSSRDKAALWKERTGESKSSLYRFARRA
jgi:hypothetical protein